MRRGTPTFSVHAEAPSGTRADGICPRATEPRQVPATAART